MTSAQLLVFTTVLIGIIWIVVHSRIAKKEFLYRSEQKKYVLKSAAFFLVIITLLLGLGASGILADFERRPPPFIFFLVFIFALPLVITFSKFGNFLVKHLTLPLLVLFQSFRILAELVIFLGVKEGIAPVQLSFEGYNFDIVTGVSALAVAVLLARKHSRRLAWAWNIMGVGFILVIAFIAMTSMPNGLRLFMNEPSNIWVTSSPYILLPGVLVSAALTAHFLAFRILSLSGFADGIQYRNF